MKEYKMYCSPPSHAIGKKHDIRPTQTPPATNPIEGI